MDWYDNVFELIDTRSFSSLWFWIVLAVLWSSTSHWVLGVPWDMVTRARRYKNPQNIRDLEDLVRINTSRILFIIHKSGLLIAGLSCFLLTVLLLLGFVYGNEFSQALFLLLMPMSVVMVLSIRTAKSIRQRQLQGEALFRRMYWHRVSTQLLGTAAIFVTAMWGMYLNITSSALGG